MTTRTSHPIDAFFKKIAESQYFLNHPQKLSAIWLPLSVITEEGRKIRLHPGMRIKVENGRIVDCVGPPTHEILECFGALTHSFSIKVKNIENEKEENIILPTF